MYALDPGLFMSTTKATYTNVQCIVKTNISKALFQSFTVRH